MSSDETVFVLGAGFTKAFLPRAPLIVDDYEGEALLGEFRSFKYAQRILRLELERKPRGKIDLERLMTRLDGRMPYDFQDEVADAEIQLLLSALMQRFRERLENARLGPFRKAELSAFAKYCIENRLTCITFNYDDVLDKALHDVRPADFGRTALSPGFLNWHPDGGYGFFCKPSPAIISDYITGTGSMAMSLLKLHGSVNWRLKLGSTMPYVIDQIVHHEDWSWYQPLSAAETEEIESHLDPSPFIVPPVLAKGAVVEQPVLRLVWSLALHKLKQAGRVVFIGYSFPQTDIAAGFLFREALDHLRSSAIGVVVSSKSERVQDELVSRYREVFPGALRTNFHFDGALQWVRQLMSRQ